MSHRKAFLTAFMALVACAEAENRWPEYGFEANFESSPQIYRPRVGLVTIGFRSNKSRLWQMVAILDPKHNGDFKSFCPVTLEKVGALYHFLDSQNAIPSCGHAATPLKRKMGTSSYLSLQWSDVDDEGTPFSLEIWPAIDRYYIAISRSYEPKRNDLFLDSVGFFSTTASRHPDAGSTRRLK